MERKVGVNNTGIDSAGLTTDYMQAIAEFIWNGFDAGATTVDINFESNELDYLNALSVTDNGEGIDLATIDESFGNFMDSIKRTNFQKSSSRLKGNKGKGRFSFVAFSRRAVWKTKYRDLQSGSILEYAITIKSGAKDKFEHSDQLISKASQTGTEVSFYDLFEVTAYSFSSPEFIDFLGREFGWFLFLNKDRHFGIRINGNPASYNNLIAQHEVLQIPVIEEEKETVFKATFIRWVHKIGDKFYFYFLDSRQKEVFKELTSFNNNAIGFYHSVYVESPFFDSFHINDNEQSLSLFECSSRNSPTFRILQARLHDLVRNKQKQFVSQHAADILISTFEKSGILPEFKNDEQGQALKTDLLNVLKGIYTAEPKIFMGLSKEQQKVNVGVIYLLLNSNKRKELVGLLTQTINPGGEEQPHLRMALAQW